MVGPNARSDAVGAGVPIDATSGIAPLDENRVVPALGTSYRFSADGITWTEVEVAPSPSQQTIDIPARSSTRKA